MSCSFHKCILGNDLYIERIIVPYFAVSISDLTKYISPKDTFPTGKRHIKAHSYYHVTVASNNDGCFKPKLSLCVPRTL